jgi:hypothetical protein
VWALLDRCRFADLPDAPLAAEPISALRAAETIDRPLGSVAFLNRLAASTDRDPRPKRRGQNQRARMGIE